MPAHSDSAAPEPRRRFIVFSMAADSAPDPRAAIKGRGRVLNLRDRTAGVPELILCPRCEGQAFDKGSCAMCGNAGYLRSYDGERLGFVEMVQILATFALATELDIAPKAALAVTEQPLGEARS